MSIKYFITKFLSSIFLILFLVQIGWAGSVTSINGTGDKTRRVLAPYAQSVPDNSYTFIGVSHPSLSTALSQIGVILEVRGMTTVPNNSAGRATVFTIASGETHRIFVVNVSHSTINTSNTAFSNSNTQAEGSTANTFFVGKSLPGDGLANILLISLDGIVQLKDAPGTSNNDYIVNSVTTDTSIKFTAASIPVGTKVFSSILFSQI